MVLHSILINDPVVPPPNGEHWPLPWLGAVLREKSCAPLTANSSMAQVEETSFDLMTQQEREMLDEVRLLPRRALLELLSHPISGEALAAFLDAVPSIPVPLPDIDITPLLRVSVDLQATIDAAVENVPACDLPVFTIWPPDPPAFDLGHLPITATSFLPP